MDESVRALLGNELLWQPYIANVYIFSRSCCNLSVFVTTHSHGVSVFIFSLHGCVCNHSNNLLIFDLAKEAARQQQSKRTSETTTTSGCKPVKVDLSSILRRHLQMQLHFVAKDTVIVTSGDQIACLSLTDNNGKRASRQGTAAVVPLVKWSWTWKSQIVSSIAKLDGSRIVLGSQLGQLAVVNWRETHKVAFSVKAQPRVLNTWFSCAGVRHAGAAQMGIHGLRIQSFQHHDNDNITTASFGDVHATWVTTCGWAMSATMDVQKGMPVKTCKVWHRSPPIRCVNHRNEDIEMNAGWSLPAHTLCIASTPDCLCWEDVPQVLQTLPDHDKFVLNDRPRQSTVSQPPTLRIMDRATGQKHQVQLSSRGQKHLTAVALHPSKEWILVATREDGLRVYNSREKI